MTRMRKSNLPEASLNMTPMIDIVFLLISFFTLVINFSKAEQNERVLLPKSELAQPPDSMPGESITFQVTETREIFIGQIACYLNENDQLPGIPFANALRDELRVIHAITGTDPAKVTAIIRADKNVRMGYVQKLIAACQAQGIEPFILRARQVRYDSDSEGI